MTDSKISALSELTTPDLSDVLAIVSGGTTKKIQLTNLYAGIGLAIVKKIGGDQTMTATDHIKVTMDTVVTDTHGYWTPASNCFTVPAGRAGVHVVIGQVQWRPYNASDGYRFIDILDATGSIFANFTWPDNKIAVTNGGYFDGEVRQQVIGLGILTEGTTVSLYAEQDNSAFASVDVQGYNTWFAILGPLGAG